MTYAPGSGRGDPRPDVGGMLRRVALIAVYVVVGVQVVALLSPADVEHPDYRTVAEIEATETGRPIAPEANVFRDLQQWKARIQTNESAPHIMETGLGQRRAWRAFPGAPPHVPHPLDPVLQRTQDCRPCHRLGGYAPSRITYAPRTPHPENAACMQCHVEEVTTTLFREIDWRTVPFPELGHVAYEGAPPTIPHPLQMRGYCPACHGGAAAAPELRSTHPERLNCRQCHVTQDEVAPFERAAPAGEGG